MSMSSPDGSGSRRRRRRLLAPSAKYDIWLQLVRGELTIADAAAVHHVDRSVILRLKKIAKEGALSALAASKPGNRDMARDAELDAAHAEIDRLSEAVKQMAVKLTLLEGKDGWG